MSQSLWIEREYVAVSCGRDDCDQEFAVKRQFYDGTRRTGETWYCPRGPTTEQKLDAAEARQRHLEDQLKAAAKKAEVADERDADLCHRFANGVCPCCNRSFENVARHMQTKHPDYDITKVAQRVEFRCSCGGAAAAVALMVAASVAAVGVIVGAVIVRCLEGRRR